MKNFYIIIYTLLISSFGFAQIPTDYYDSADGLTGFDLKTELKNIISNGHIARTYNQLYDGGGISGSNGYEDTHSDVPVSSGNLYENDGTILDFYSEDPTGPDPYNYTHGVNQCGNQSTEGDCYNREHLIPQSSFNSFYPMQSDIHHVVPTDGRVNNFRGSLPFGNVATPNFTSLNGSKRGSSAIAGYSGLVFEPIDEFKGDIARAILYFATRYEDTVANYTSFDMFNGTLDEVFYPWAIEVLLDWHYNVDPVNERELVRNEAAYKFQNNANPFVDHPEYANMIWNPSTDTEVPSTPTNLIASNPTDNSIDLSWEASTDNVAVASYDIYVDSELSFNTVDTSITVEDLSSNTYYCFTVRAIDTSDNPSGYSNEDCATTTDNGSTGGSVDLFFSEYIEGSGNNKVLEIANFTGGSVDLANYSLKLSSNGNASWSTTYSFPANSILSNQDVYVIGNGSSTVCTSEYDDTNNAITSFNGNDAIGLFKNETLIDILGDFNSSATYAQNTTLIRKSSVTSPTTSFNINEWDSYTSNYCSNLGAHSQSLSLKEFKPESLSFYPNPVKSKLNINLIRDMSTQVEIYNILGKRVINQTINSSSVINTQSLQTGVYILKITQGNNSLSKRLIKN